MAHRVINYYTKEEVQPLKYDPNQWDEFDSPTEGLEYMIAHKNGGHLTLGEILYKIQETWKPLEVGGLKMENHYIWNNHVFFLMGRFCYYVGEIKL